MAERIQITVDGATRTFSAPGPVVLGRDGAACAVVLRHRAVSGRHAQLSHDGRHWVLLDLGSTNGTWLDGQAVTGPTPIRTVTTVRLGKTDDGSDITIDPSPLAGTGASDPSVTKRPVPPPVVPPVVPPAAPQFPSPVGSGTHVPAGETVIIGPGPATAQTGPPLLASLGARTVTLPALAGRVYTVGREASCDVVSAEMTVSREHLKLAWVPGHDWQMTDVSARGTFTAGGAPLGKGVPTPLRSSTTLRLGDPSTGEPLSLTLSGTELVPAPWWRRPASLIAASVVLVILLAGGTAVAMNRSGKPHTTTDVTKPPTGDDVLTAAELAVVKKSVVKLSIVLKDGSDGGWGSGTIISNDGLILTNAHVGNPLAPGLVAQYGFLSAPEFAADKAVDHLIVGITAKPDSPAVDTYLAKPMVTDGYVDLSVVKIYAKADGSALPAALKLPALPIGDPDKMKVGDPMTILGFPGAAGSDLITVNPGGISSAIKDDHMSSERAFFESTGDIRHGNSGGSAVNAAGQLIAVPTRGGDNDERSDRARPVNWAAPLIAIAKKGGDPNYFSPYLTKLSGAEKATGNGVAKAPLKQCTDASAKTLPSGSAPVVASFSVDAPKGVDLYPILYSLTSAGKLGSAVAANQDQSSGSDECAIVGVSDGLDDGAYAAVLFAGPDAEKVLGSFAFTIGATTQGIPGDGGTPEVGTQPVAGYCTPGNPVTSWPGTQSVKLDAVPRASDNKIVVKGGKILVIANLGSADGYTAVADADRIATAAISTDLGPGPYGGSGGALGGSSYERWMVLQVGGRFYALQGNYRPDVVSGGGDSDSTPALNANDDDWCFTPPNEYKVASWHSVFYVAGSLGQWYRFDSIPNTLTPITG